MKFAVKLAAIGSVFILGGVLLMILNYTGNVHWKSNYRDQTQNEQQRYAVENEEDTPLSGESQKPLIPSPKPTIKTPPPLTTTEKSSNFITKETTSMTKMTSKGETTNFMTSDNQKEPTSNKPLPDVTEEKSTAKEVTLKDTITTTDSEALTDSTTDQGVTSEMNTDSATYAGEKTVTFEKPASESVTSDSATSGSVEPSSSETVTYKPDVTQQTVTAEIMTSEIQTNDKSTESTIHHTYVNTEDLTSTELEMTTEIKTEETQVTTSSAPDTTTLEPSSKLTTSKPEVTTTDKEVPCKDLATECAFFGKSACNTYTSFMSQYCTCFCGLNTASSTEPSVSIVSPKVSECKDTADNCTKYGLTYCNQYPDWSKNYCPKFCGFCQDQTAITSSPLAPTRPVEQTPGKVGSDATEVITTTEKACSENCTDRKDVDCIQYGKSACTNYRPWATVRCSKYCGFCTPCAVEVCEDTVPNCKEYQADMCVSETFRVWAEKHCSKFCGFCGSKTTPAPQAVTTVPATASTATKTIVDAHGCRDMIADCRTYITVEMCHGTYEPWARANCASYCGFCGTPFPKRCTDAIHNCNEYQADMCTSPTFRIFREDNCAGFCKLCENDTTTEATTVGTGPPDVTGAGIPSVCEDDPSFNCTFYGKNDCIDFTAIMRQNCPKFCGMCQDITASTALEPTTEEPKCKDAGKKEHSFSEIWFDESSCSRVCECENPSGNKITCRDRDPQDCEKVSNPEICCAQGSTSSVPSSDSAIPV